MTNNESKKEVQSNNGFVFGLTLGAAVGALSALLINKNKDQEVVLNFESKIKEFFQDLIDNIQTKTEPSSKKIEFIKIVENNQKESETTENPPIVIKRKSPPKMFVKPKR